MTNADWARIKRRCLKEHGARPFRAPEGYFYWIDRDNNAIAAAESIYTYRASDLTEEQWLAHAAAAALAASEAAEDRARHLAYAAETEARRRAKAADAAEEKALLLAGIAEAAAKFEP